MKRWIAKFANHHISSMRVANVPHVKIIVFLVQIMKLVKLAKPDSSSQILLVFLANLIAYPVSPRLIANNVTSAFMFPKECVVPAQITV